MIRTYVSYRIIKPVFGVMLVYYILTPPWMVDPVGAIYVWMSCHG